MRTFEILYMCANGSCSCLTSSDARVLSVCLLLFFLWLACSVVYVKCRLQIPVGNCGCNEIASGHVGSEILISALIYQDFKQLEAGEHGRHNHSQIPEQIARVQPCKSSYSSNQQTENLQRSIAMFGDLPW